MAFFRTGGGGGIPAALKSAMNAVLNKKFGTAQTYEPNDWPDDVNLLGALEEKTVSAAPIASFSDGADVVPIKNWIVNLPASLDGYTEVNGTKHNKNFYSILIGADRFTNNGSATHSNDNGTLVIVTSTGAASGVYINTSDTLCEVRNVLKWFYDNDYSKTISFDVIASVDNVSMRVTSGTNTLFTVGTTSTRVSHVSTSNNFSIYTVNTPATIRISNFQIEYGNTGTAYEAYEAPTQYIADLDRTIYGGSADIVTGEGENLCDKYIITGQETGDFLAGTNNNGNRIGLNGFGLAQKPLYTGGLCNIVGSENKACLNSGSWTIGSWCIYTDNKLYFVVPNEYTTFSTALQYLLDNNATFIFPLATPTEFTFDPITPTPDTALGANNFWIDDGDSAVTYRSSGTETFIQPTLISKTITENGTYNAADDDADGYDQVTIDVEGEEMNYSTTEHAAGTWIDGTVIYERTFELESQLTVSSSTWTSSGIAGDGINKIIGVELFGVSNYQGGGLANIQNNVIMLQTTRNSDACVKEFSLRYLKTV